MYYLTLIFTAALWCITVESDLDPLAVSPYHLKLRENDEKLVFEYLDRDGDGVLLRADREKLFNHHAEAAPDVDKLLTAVGSEKEDGSDLNFEKFAAFLNDRTVTMAVFECTYVRAVTVRRRCYEDQLVMYVHLVLPRDVIDDFFKSFNAPNGITIEQVKPLFPQDQEERAHKLLREMAGSDEVIQESEFNKYVRQEDLHDDFRACYGQDHKYDLMCLRNKLGRYSTEALTEMDIANIFSAIDTKNKDKRIRSNDIVKWCQGQCDPIVFLTMMNPYQDDSAVDFGEFRTFIQRPTVKIRIERSCNVKHPTLAAELACYQQQLFRIVSEHHKPIWITLPSADILFLFEDIDKNNNGQIQVLADLESYGYPPEVAEKFRREIDGDDVDKKVSFQEFNEYMAGPSLVYALTECKPTPRGQDRIDCYKKELMKYIQNILDKDLIENLFKSYDTNKNGFITPDDLGSRLETQEDIDNFLSELAIGDLPIIRSEFSWYVRQQELSSMFRAEGCEKDIPCLQRVLLKYMLTKLTEPTIQRFFMVMDRDFGPFGGGGIDYEDLRLSPYFKAKSDEEVQLLLDKMDPDKDKLVSFEEFRDFLFLNGRKKQLEIKCTEPEKKNEVDIWCYQNEIWNLP